LKGVNLDKDSKPKRDKDSSFDSSVDLEAQAKYQKAKSIVFEKKQSYNLEIEENDEFETERNLDTKRAMITQKNLALHMS
jgi:hypothetical protein